jgi:hypothetical protein
MRNTRESHIEKTIVLDTQSTWIYIGTREAVRDNCAILSQVDVHGSKDSSTSKDLYKSDTRTSGIKSNRNSVYVNFEYVVSFSIPEDVKQF